MNIDYEKLRQDLIDYFGSAMGLFQVAVMDVTIVENASNAELLEIANKNGFDLRDYEIEKIFKL